MQPGLIKDWYTGYQICIFQWIMTHENTGSQPKEGKDPQNLWKILKEFFFLSNCAIVLKLKWMGCMDRFDAYIRLRICIQVLACNVLVHYGVSSSQCMDSVQVDALWNLQVWSWLIYTYLEFHIAIVLAIMVAEWEDVHVGVFIIQTVWPMPPKKFTEDLPCQ